MILSWHPYGNTWMRGMPERTPSSPKKPKNFKTQVQDWLLSGSDQDSESEQCVRGFDDGARSVSGDLDGMEADRDRLRSLLSDRDDQVGWLQTQISELETERDRPLRDRDSLRASITNFASRLAMPSSSSSVVVALSLPGTSGVEDSAAPPNVRSKRPRNFAPVPPLLNKKPKTGTSCPSRAFRGP